MKLNFKNLPVGNLPYENIQSCKQLMLRLYEDIPFLPELPLMNPNDDVYHKVLDNIPFVQFKEGKILISESSNDKLMQKVMHLEKVYNSFNLGEDLENYAFESPYMEMYIEILKRLKPTMTVFNIIGPFTLANSFMNKNASTMILDKTYRKFVMYLIIAKALWFIKKIKEASPDTTPLIVFDERMLFKFGTLKRTNESITKETVSMLMARVFSRLRKEGAKICVQAFEKCNWQLVFDTECVDMISFDAYNNPSSLNILAHNVNNFLAKGGCINWGFVPVMNENAIRSLNLATLQNRLKLTMEGLADQGVSYDLLLNNSTVSVQGDLYKYPILFAEKALMLASQLSAKLSDKN